MDINAKREDEKFKIVFNVTIDLTTVIIKVTQFLLEKLISFLSGQWDESNKT